jgi:hypothetical protein
VGRHRFIFRYEMNLLRLAHLSHFRTQQATPKSGRGPSGNKWRTRITFLQAHSG